MTRMARLLQSCRCCCTAAAGLGLSPSASSRWGSSAPVLAPAICHLWASQSQAQHPEEQVLLYSRCRFEPQCICELPVGFHARTMPPFPSI